MERREHRAERRLDQPPADAGTAGRLGPGARVQELVELDAARRLPRRGDRGQHRRAGDRRRADGRLHRRRAGADRPGARLGARPSELGAVVIDAAHKGAHGMVVLTGTDTGARDNRTDRRSGPRVRDSRARSGRARPDQHRPGDRAQRDAGADAAARWRRPVLPVGGGRRRAAQPRRTATTSVCRPSSVRATTPT